MFLLYASFLQAQSSDGIAQIKAFAGADSEEELDPYEVEKMQDYLSSPLRLNEASAARLLSSGLLTQYQVASFMDYTARSGAVLSLAELAAVDGFGQDFTDRLSPFISLGTSSLPGQPPGSVRKAHSDLSLKAGYRHTAGESDRYMWGTRYRLRSERGLSVTLAATKPYDGHGMAPSLVSGNISLTLGHSGSMIVAGDFNARFGQGLALWNGMVMSGISGPSSLSRKGSGISESYSFTGSSAFTGVAAAIHKGRFVISALGAFPGIRQMLSEKGGVLSFLPALNLAWYGRNSQISITDYAEFSGLNTDAPRIPHMKTSADLRFCIRGTDLFSEVAYDWVNTSTAFICGTSFPVSDDLRAAVMARMYPSAFDGHLSAAPKTGSRCSNETGLSLAADLKTGDHVTINGAEGFGSSVRRHQGTFSVDAAMNPGSRSDDGVRSCQIKGLVSWQSMLSERFRLSVRISERYRNRDDAKLRSELRLNLTYLSSLFTSALRADLVKCSGFGFLTYAEAGYASERLKVYLRQGVFAVDDWDDRIYAYERDAPGNFSVPAYYGRGLWTAFYGSWRFAGWGRLYARASVVTYPFMEKKKPGKAELKLQMEFSF